MIKTNDERHVDFFIYIYIVIEYWTNNDILQLPNKVLILKNYSLKGVSTF